MLTQVKLCHSAILLQKLAGVFCVPEVAAYIPPGEAHQFAHRLEISARRYTNVFQESTAFLTGHGVPSWLLARKGVQAMRNVQALSGEKSAGTNLDAEGPLAAVLTCMLQESIPIPR